MGSPRFGVDSYGHLVIYGPSGRWVMVRLEESGAGIAHERSESVVLPWDAYAQWVGGASPRDSWTLTANVLGRAPTGIAVYTSGIYAVATHEMHLAARGGWWQRFNRVWGAQGDHALALVVVPDASLRSCTSQRATIRALFEVLKSCPDLRPRLEDANRMEQLALALAARCVGPSVERTGVSRDGVDILYALHACGYVHRYGRPLPCDTIAPLDQVVEQIAAAVSRNPYRSHRGIDLDVVQGYVRRNYSDVTPWPFEALTG